MKQLLTIIYIIFTSAAFAHSWTETNSPTKNDLNSVSAPNDSVAWVCGNDGTLLLTTSGGRIWVDKSGSPVIGTNNLLNINAINADLALCTASPETDAATHKTTAYIYRTSDRGRTWTKVFTQTGGYGNSIYMFDYKRGVFIGNPINGRWSIFTTNDGGITWDSTGIKLMAASPDEASRNNSIQGQFFGKTVMFGTNNGRYYISHDYGKSWEAQIVPGASHIYAIAFADTVNGMVAGTGLFKTTDGGKNWLDLSSQALGGKGDIIAMVSHDFWEYGIIRESTPGTSEHCVYQSNNFGEGYWDTAYAAPENKPYNALVQASDGGYFYAVRQGGGISVGVHDDPPVTDVNDKNNPVLHQYSLSQNYPNPFNPSTKISYTVASTGYITLKVYNLIGNLVATLVNEEQPAGSYTVDFNGNNLPSGLYIYELKAGSFSMNRKMLLVK